MNTVEISSFSNPVFKHLKSLSKSRNRKKEGLFLMEGRPELDIAFRTGWKPHTIAFTDAYADVDLISSLVDVGGVKLLRLSRALFDDLAYQRVPGNFIAVLESRQFELADLEARPPLVVLESAEKPGNLGAILRTCDGAGVKEIIVTETAIDLFNPNVIRNSRGAVFTVKAVFCSNKEAWNHIRGRHLTTLAAALSDTAIDYRSVHRDVPSALVFGPESTGLSAYWLERADRHIAIPMRGVVDSLNVSVSVGIILNDFISR